MHYAARCSGKFEAYNNTNKSYFSLNSRFQLVPALSHITCDYRLSFPRHSSSALANITSTWEASYISFVSLKRLVYSYLTWFTFSIEWKHCQFLNDYTKKKNWLHLVFIILWHNSHFPSGFKYIPIKCHLNWRSLFQNWRTLLKGSKWPFMWNHYQITGNFQYG